MPKSTTPAPPLDLARPVQLYRNLNKKCWSVKQGGRVVAHLDTITLSSIQMTVRPSGRERVRRTGQKNVHAWVTGTICKEVPPPNALRLSYDPYTDDEFQCQGEPVKQAQYAHFDYQGKATIWNALP